MTDEPARTTIDDLLRDARSRLVRLEPDDALAAQQTGALLIDTRSADERQREGVIPGALHIPLSVLSGDSTPPNPAFHNPHVEGLDQQLVLVCAHGYSTSLAAARPAARVRAYGRRRRVHGLARRRPARASRDERPPPVPGMGDPDPS